MARPAHSNLIFMKNLLAFGLLGLLLTACSETANDTDETDLLDMYEDEETVSEDEEVSSEDQAEVDSVVGPTEIPDDLVPNE